MKERRRFKDIKVKRMGLLLQAGGLKKGFLKRLGLTRIGNQVVDKDKEDSLPGRGLSKHQTLRQEQCNCAPVKARRPV